MGSQCRLGFREYDSQRFWISRRARRQRAFLIRGLGLHLLQLLEQAMNGFPGRFQRLGGGFAREPLRGGQAQPFDVFKVFAQPQIPQTHAKFPFRGGHLLLQCGLFDFLFLSRRFEARQFINLGGKPQDFGRRNGLVELTLQAHNFQLDARQGGLPFQRILMGFAGFRQETFRHLGQVGQSRQHQFRLLKLRNRRQGILAALQPIHLGADGNGGSLEFRTTLLGPGDFLFQLRPRLRLQLFFSEAAFQ